MLVIASVRPACASFRPPASSGRASSGPNNRRHCSTGHSRVHAVHRNVSNSGSHGGGGTWSGKVTGSDDGDSERRGHSKWALLALVIAGCACWLVVTTPRSWVQYYDHPGRVSIIIPALNEEKCIADTIRAVLSLSPAPHEVLVVDGNSQDRTKEIVAGLGVHLLQSQPGRAKQMNQGADAASGDLLCFLHADTQPPKELVAVIRGVMNNTKNVLGGFRTIIQTDGKRLHGMTLHHLVKTYYVAMLLRPLAFVRGIRCLFGDQTLFCRAADFRAVGGFKDDLPIMEDVDLSIRLHEAGSAAKAETLQGHQTKPGRTFMVMNPANVTSGRRLSNWGAVQATWIHFYIALRWYFGASPDQMYKIYHSMYTDNHR